MTVKLASSGHKCRKGRQVSVTKLLLTVALVALTFAFGIRYIRHQLFGDLATQVHLGKKEKN